jgi:hypothetical protein
MPQRAFLAAGMLIRATRQMIEHFRKGESLTAWYLREVQKPWLHLNRLRIVSGDET